MTDVLLWSACLSGWLFDVLLIADRAYQEVACEPA